MNKQCKICGKDFLTYLSTIKIGKGKFCSRKCMGKWQSENRCGEKSSRWEGGKIKRICKICGKGFEGTRTAIKKGHAKYCSWNCSNKGRIGTISGEKSPTWKGGKFPVKCKFCGKTFHLHPSKILEGRKFCSQSCSGSHTFLNAKKENTSIEIKMEQELNRHGITFKKQYPIWQAKTIPDFFIPPNICIYCDGDYWHNLPNTKLKDRQQDFILKFLGYKVYRFWEYEINKNVKKCVELLHYKRTFLERGKQPCLKTSTKTSWNPCK